MASRKEGYDEKIIECSQKEFLEKGYINASLRAIASEAGVSTSTIYTRFKDKAGLFQYLISPTEKIITYMENTLEKYFSMSIEKQKEQFHETGDAGYDAIIEMIYADYNAYKLLITCAPGDIYKNYLDRITNLDVKYTMLYLEESKSKALKEGRINEGFCQVVSTAYYSAMFHCVDQDMSKDEAGHYINELKNFYRRGWAELFLSD